MYAHLLGPGEKKLEALGSSWEQGGFSLFAIFRFYAFPSLSCCLAHRRRLNPLERFRIYSHPLKDEPTALTRTACIQAANLQRTSEADSRLFQHSWSMLNSGDRAVGRR